MSEPCLLDDICKVLGYEPGTRLLVILTRINVLQYYIGQLERVEKIAAEA